MMYGWGTFEIEREKQDGSGLTCHVCHGSGPEHVSAVIHIGETGAPSIQSTGSGPFVCAPIPSGCDDLVHRSTHAELDPVPVLRPIEARALLELRQAIVFERNGEALMWLDTLVAELTLNKDPWSDVSKAL